MAIYSPLRSRRLAGDKAEVTQRILTFKLGEELFALPLAAVHKAIVLDRVYGDPNGTGVGLTTYQGRELVIIDVAQRIFGRDPDETLAQATFDRDTQAVRYTIVLQPEPNRFVGLPIDSPPSIQSLPMSAFGALPEIYRRNSNVHCISSLSVETPDRPSIFLLDVARLLAPLSGDLV
jgi:chemotaxis signal transduction protein